MLSYFATTVQSINPYGSLYKLYSVLFSAIPFLAPVSSHLPRWIVLIRRRDNGRWALPGGIVDWGRYFHNGTKGASRETGLELVKIRRLVGVYSAPDRDPRIHSICILVEAEVQKMKVQDTLEVTEIQAFSPHLYLRVSFPMTTISSCKTILTA